MKKVHPFHIVLDPTKMVEGFILSKTDWVTLSRFRTDVGKCGSNLAINMGNNDQRCKMCLWGANPDDATYVQRMASNKICNTLSSNIISCNRFIQRVASCSKIYKFIK